MTAPVGETRPKTVTRDVELSAVQDLLDRPPRATLTFAEGGEVDILPARAHCTGGTYLVGVQPDAAPDLQNREVVLVIDDGPYWFELRGVSVRGVAARIEPPADGSAALAWYALAPRRILSWDYGAIREA